MKEFEELTFREIAEALDLPLEHSEEPALYGVETIANAACRSFGRKQLEVAAYERDEQLSTTCERATRLGRVLYTAKPSET